MNAARGGRGLDAHYSGGRLLASIVSGYGAIGAIFDDMLGNVRKVNLKQLLRYLWAFNAGTFRNPQRFFRIKVGPRAFVWHTLRECRNIVRQSIAGVARHLRRPLLITNPLHAWIEYQQRIQQLASGNAVGIG